MINIFPSKNKFTGYGMNKHDASIYIYSFDSYLSDVVNLQDSKVILTTRSDLSVAVLINTTAKFVALFRQFFPFFDLLQTSLRSAYGLDSYEGYPLVEVSDQNIVDNDSLFCVDICQL